jgi:peptide deformylase
MEKESKKREHILLLGDPLLRKRAKPVEEFSSAEFQRDGRRLLNALEQFRAEHGFGRAIAAPQIGILQRMIAMNLGQGPFLIVNPRITVAGQDRFTLWDDCMSLPWLMVRLARFRKIRLDFQDASGAPRHWKEVELPTGELIQHETDHLDGVLAVDHALDRDAIIARSVYEAQREFFDSQVDYTILPTIAQSD